MPGTRALVAAALAAALAACPGPTARPPSTASARPRVLVLTRTAAFRHRSMPAAVAAAHRLGARGGFAVVATDRATLFTGDGLRGFAAILFLLTTGDVLDDAQQDALERFVRAGGGFAGVHSATDTEYGWPFYGTLVGARFRNHPRVQRATVRVADPAHPSTRALPPRWLRTDEWYNFRSDPTARVHVLATVDERTYRGGTMGRAHPIAWCRAVGRGRSWYTAMGHAPDAYREPLFLEHMLGGIRWAAGLAPGECG